MTLLIEHLIILLAEEVCANTSCKVGAQIPHLPLGDDSSPRGR
jgi:hypothetical protein